MTTKIKDTDIKKLSTTKQEFMFALKKVSQRIEKKGKVVKSG